MNILRISGFMLLASVWLWSCNNSSPKAQTDFEKLLQQRDSLVKVDQLFSDSLQELRSEHEALVQRITDATVVEESLIRKLAEHPAMAEGIEASFAEHEKLQASHDSLLKSGGIEKLSERARQAQINVMIEQHESMMSDHKKIRTKFQEFIDEHNKLRRALESISPQDR